MNSCRPDHVFLTPFPAASKPPPKLQRVVQPARIIQLPVNQAIEGVISGRDCCPTFVSAAGQEDDISADRKNDSR